MIRTLVARAHQRGGHRSADLGDDLRDHRSCSSSASVSPSLAELPDLGPLLPDVDLIEDLRRADLGSAIRQTIGGTGRIGDSATEPSVADTDDDQD